MIDSRRQEVLDVTLAQVLNRRGIVAAPESVVYADSRRRLPDVLVEYRGLRLMIEGEVDDQPNAEEKAFHAARRRLEEGLAHIGIAVVYPASLRDVPFERLFASLEVTRFTFAVLTESQANPAFVKGKFDDLTDALERAYDHLLHEDVVAEAVAVIDAVVEQFAQTMLSNLRVHIPIIAEVLEMADLPKRGGKKMPAPDLDDEAEDDLPKSTRQATADLRSEVAQQAAICRIGGLILLNALIFQEVLSQHNATVKGLPSLLAQRTPVLSFSTHWEHVYTDIDYFPIFHLAHQVLIKLPSSPELVETFDALGSAALRIVGMRAALQHDLMGRVYHRLLSQAKYLGTYYTSIPAATLLLKLALHPKNWTVDWSALDQVRQFRAADLSCGTGTLLMATADAILNNHVNASAAQGAMPQRADLQKTLAEDILYGYDVLASAIHLTASTLALRSPEKTFDKMNLFALPLGGEGLQLGSLEFGAAFQIALPHDAFGSARQVTGKGDLITFEANLPKLDLCVMNPPFVRSVGGNLLFGSLPDSERARTQQRLQRVIKQRNLSANITAGLGAVFVAVAHPYIKEGGRIALILPKALLSGVAWEKTRQLINQHYRIEYLIASQDPERWNFSESTDLSEVMLIAAKLTDDESTLPTGERPDLYYMTNGGRSKASVFTLRRNPLARERFQGTIAINLRRNVRTVFEALTVAQTVARESFTDLLSGQGATAIMYGETQMAECFSLTYEKTKENWMLPCAFAQADLTRAAYALLGGEVWLPGVKRRTSIAFCPLGELGILGPDRRDLTDGFELSKVKTTYPAFWGHTASEVTSIAQTPNTYLKARPKPLPKRPLRRVEDLFPLSGRILLAERLRVNTQRLFALRLNKPVLSNVWWSFQLNTPNERREKVLALWLNSTLHALMVLANRVETHGAWIQFKKPTLAALPVLDVRLLNDAQLDVLAAEYDKLCEAPLQPFPAMATDPTRRAIDEAFAAALGFPDLNALRELLAQEPVVCLRRL